MPLLVIAANFMFNLNSKNKISNDFEDEKPIFKEKQLEPEEEVKPSDFFEVENVEGDVTLHSIKKSIIIEEEEEEQPIIDDRDIVEPIIIEKQKNNKRLVYKKRDGSN